MKSEESFVREAMATGVARGEAEALAAFWVAMKETIVVCGGTLGCLTPDRAAAFEALGDKLADLVRAAKAN